MAYGNGRYVGHPISSDNGIISLKLLLKSEFYCQLHVAMGAMFEILRSKKGLRLYIPD